MVVLCRYGEIFLKGGNRSFFERLLVSSITAFMERDHVPGQVLSLRNRIVIETDDYCRFLSRVFGIISFSPVVRTPFNPQFPQLDQIVDAAVSLLSSRSFSSFKVRAQRLTPAGQLSSIQINERVGAALVERFGVRVDLEEPSITVGIEIIDEYAYVFVDTCPGPGGLPVGVSGTVIVLMDERYAELSALLMMKRGCEVVGAGNKVREFSILDFFIPSGFRFIPLHSGLVLDTIAQSVGALALVASSHVRDISLNTQLPILNPLAGMNEEEAASKLHEYESIKNKIFEPTKYQGISRL